MEIKGYRWAGVRTTSFDSTTDFFSDVMGFKLAFRNDNDASARFELSSGQHFEVLGPNNPYASFHTAPVLAFEVEDVQAARVELAERGVEFVSDVAQFEDESWVYFRGPDGVVYELFQRGVS